MAHKLIVMKDGEVVESGTADEVFDAPRTDYAQALMAAAFDLEVRAGVSE
jgi:microcin C transport system ATP-binding protein